jgi:TonB family protein
LVLQANCFHKFMSIALYNPWLFQNAKVAAMRAAIGLTLAVGLFPSVGRGAATAEPILIEPKKTGEPGAPRVSTDRSGTLATSDGLTLRLTTDLGSVRIVSLEPGAAQVVRYTVHIETDARQPQAQSLLDHYALQAKSTASGVEINGSLPAQFAHSSSSAQFWVQYVVAVPSGYNVEVNTGAGDIETQEIGGTANLLTQGGNIRTGRIGFRGPHRVSAGHPIAKLETEGGHIQMMDVAGDTSAFTAGGHINAGNISGDATLRSGGGHIRAGQIGGRAQLETDGGNISVGQAENFVSVRTGGGQIDFGEVRGSVHAQTGGGGIRVMYVSGPMEVESSGGSICLTRVAGSVRAATGNGTITAWINPDGPSPGGTVKLAGASQLATGAGDIIVFLPRNLAATIDATAETGGEHRIEADPALQLNVQSPANHAPGPVHATGVLNGGGELLKLRTTAGKIHLEFLDYQIALRESLIREQKERLAHHPGDGELLPVSSLPEPLLPPMPPEAPRLENKGDWLDGMMDRLESAILGGVREDTDEFRKRIVYSPPPAYPDFARRAGVQGVVRLQVRLSKDGRIEVQKILEGEPALADAAIAAVKQWRAKPEWVNGNPVDVISTVTFNFKLR